MNRIEQLQSFLAESPDDNFLIHALALEFVKQGDEQSALSSFLKNLENSPAYVPTYYHLGKLYERIDETEKAIEIYQKGMEAAKNAGDNHAFSELRSVHDELIY
jgi:tetratricopeptide (TPR) repeat protein